jgi:hypothetical protein
MRHFGESRNPVLEYGNPPYALNSYNYLLVLIIEADFFITAQQSRKSDLILPAFVGGGG